MHSVDNKYSKTAYKPENKILNVILEGSKVIFENTHLEDIASLF
jgi:hypothetical protein